MAQIHAQTAQPTTEEQRTEFTAWVVRQAEANEMNYSDLRGEEVHPLAAEWWGAGWEELTDAQAADIARVVRRNFGRIQ